jgi:predicted RNA-binding protein associated with RNAse of E/G family
MSQLIQFEYHRPGKDTVVYEEHLVLDRPDVKVLLQNYRGSEVDVGGSVTLQHGSPIVWFIFDGAWHDIGSFHLKDGTLTGWYTNLSKPVVFTQDKWVGNDLFLDLWQPVRDQPIWLDKDEFDAAIRAKLIDQATSKRVLNERALIDHQVSRGEWPPPIVRDIDLRQARALLET